MYPLEVPPTSGGQFKPGAIHPVTDTWVKRDTDTGRFMGQKKDGTPFKGVRKERGK